MEGKWDQRRQRVWGWKCITKGAKDKDGLFQFKLHFPILLIASTLHYCMFLEILLCNSVVLSSSSSPFSVAGVVHSTVWRCQPLEPNSIPNPNISNVCESRVLWGSPNSNFTNSLQGKISLWSFCVSQCILGYKLGFLVWGNLRIEWYALHLTLSLLYVHAACDNV